MSDENELNEEAAPAERRSVVPIRVALLIGAVVVVLVAIGLSNLRFGVGSSGTATDNSSHSASAEPGKYQGTDRLCQTVDRERYEDIVGMKSEVESESADGPPAEDSGTMECDLGSSDRNGPVKHHKLLIQAELYVDAAEAKTRYEEFIRDSNVNTKKMNHHKGAWEQAVSYQNKSDDMHLLVVHDNNITLKFRQTVDPFDAMATNDAVTLMTDYAEQSLSALKK